MRLSGPAGGRLPIRVTEFSYLLSGRYRISEEQAAAWWPRAIRQAQRWSEQLVVYGLGPVHESSRWGSASLLDGEGFGARSLRVLAGVRGVPFRMVRPVPVTFREPSGSLPVSDLRGEGAAVEEPRLVEEEPVAVEDPPVVEPDVPVEDPPVVDVDENEGE
jgi:hypothetical protein